MTKAQDMSKQASPQQYQFSGYYASDLIEGRLFYGLLSRTLRICCNTLDRVCYIFRVPLCDLPSRGSLLTPLIHQNPSNLRDAHTSQEEVYGSQSEKVVSLNPEGAYRR